MVDKIEQSIANAFNDTQKVFQNFISDKENLEKINHLSEVIANTFINKGKVLVCGNGGSHCDAMHFAEEFTGRFRKNRIALPALALGNGPHVTCVGNDFGFAEIFSREVEAYGQKGDVLIVMSTSGNSENIIRAVEKAKSLGLKIAALTGKDGGKLKGLCDMEWVVNAENSDRIQEVHMSALHILIEAVERRLFPENY